MKTLIYSVESLKSRVECLFVSFFFALPLTVAHMPSGGLRTIQLSNRGEV
ncbi:hypothetical protein LX69_03539 [Breznakibacter xylanolyticus]|uniref:Uncharacterized protein n=1 Tax=Breznakibacter xylanolyticus TaxID=990 RepID=A0A2W7MYF8_9BACT|nr:hypothetical protein LX69_03539 [Breznakibacter xylanolyticus]